MKHGTKELQCSVQYGEGTGGAHRRVSMNAQYEALIDLWLMRLEYGM
jgi:hypothetical protein